MRFRFGCLCLLSITLLAGCDAPAGSSGSSDSPRVEAKKGKIGYSAMSLTNPFFKIIADTIDENAAAQGYEVIVNDSQSKVDEQAKHIDNYITQGVTAIVVNPVDRTAIGPAIKKANEAGIPVFTCDLQCTADGVKIAGHIGTDNFQGGELAGQAMIEALGDEGGKVLVLHFKQANSCVLRVDGFRKVIDEYNKDREEGRIEIVSELDGGGDKDIGFNAAAAALETHSDLAGIFAINDPSAIGAWFALKQAGKEDLVTIVGFDGQLDGKQAIKEGKIYADPIQFPKQMGEVTVENIVKYLNGEEFEKTVLIPTKLYKKADAETDPELSGGEPIEITAPKGSSDTSDGEKTPEPTSPTE